MSEEEQFEKYTKGGAIALHGFFFIWSGFIVTFLCYGLLPKHWFIFFAILSAVWTAFFKLTQLIISKGVPTDDADDYCPEGISDRITNDICTGIAPHGYWWDNSTTTTHTHDPYISTTTYTSYDRDR